MQVVAKADQITDNFLNLGASSAGVYGTKFWPLGVPAEIRVDDRLLHWGSNPFFAKQGEDGEYWPSILEKAFAKLHGNYARTSGGDPARGVSYLTGAPSEVIWKNTQLSE